MNTLEISKRLLRLAAKIDRRPVLFQKVKNELFENTPCFDDLKNIGIDVKLNDDYEMHHLDNKKKKFFKTQSKKDGYTLAQIYQQIIDKLNEIKQLYKENSYEELKNEAIKGELKELFQQLDILVLIPKWYHHYIHNNKLKFNSRKQCYQHLKTLLKNVKNSSQIQQLKFDGSSIKNALNSIQKLAQIIKFNQLDENLFIKKIKQSFDQLKKYFIEYVVQL